MKENRVGGTRMMLLLLFLFVAGGAGMYAQTFTFGKTQSYSIVDEKGTLNYGKASANYIYSATVDMQNYKITIVKKNEKGAVLSKSQFDVKKKDGLDYSENQLTFYTTADKMIVFMRDGRLMLISNPKDATNGLAYSASDDAFVQDVLMGMLDPDEKESNFKKLLKTVKRIGGS